MDRLSDYLLKKRLLVDAALDRYLPCVDREPRAIHECMRYSTEGGKRLRPLVTLAVAEMLGCPAEKVSPTCAAIELIHTHSLILDDLPCMDDDDFRRGRPTCHKRFGESVALLAADALLNLAISLLGANYRLGGILPETALEIIHEVGEAVGTDGVIGGQMADLSFSASGAGPTTLERIHVAKTARLFRLSARAGAMVAGARPEVVDRVGSYGEHLGLAFQIVDDLLDRVDDDGENHRKGRAEPSYVRAFTLVGARALAIGATDSALESLSAFAQEADVLRDLARHNLARET